MSSMTIQDTLFQLEEMAVFGVGIAATVPLHFTKPKCKPKPNAPAPTVIPPEVHVSPPPIIARKQSLSPVRPSRSTSDATQGQQGIMQMLGRTMSSSTPISPPQSSVLIQQQPAPPPKRKTTSNSRINFTESVFGPPETFFASDHSLSGTSPLDERSFRRERVFSSSDVPSALEFEEMQRILQKHRRAGGDYTHLVQEMPLRTRSMSV